MSDKPYDCPTCGQTHPRGCQAHKKAARGGGPCLATPVPGGTVCKWHGGNSPRAQAAATQRLATLAAAEQVARLGLRVDIHPADALIDLVHWTAGEVAYWRAKTVEIADADGPDALTWGTTRVKEGGDDRGTTQEAKPHIYLVMLRDASDRLAQYAAAALKAGVEERRVRLAEKQGDLIATMQRAILDRMFAAVVELLRANGIDDEKIIAALQRGWADAMGIVVPEELRRLIEGNGE